MNVLYKQLQTVESHSRDIAMKVNTQGDVLSEIKDEIGRVRADIGRLPGAKRW